MEMQEMITMANAAQAFGLSKEFEVAADAATVASWGGGQVWLEVFPTGEYRLIPGSALGNLYNSPGVLIAIPPLVDDEWDPNPRFYENARASFLTKAEEIFFVLCDV